MTPPDPKSDRPPNQPHRPDPNARTVRLAPGVEIPEDALRYTASRSSGPGGQNVNRRSTRVELRVALADIPITPGARRRLESLASHLVTAAGELHIAAEEERSQKRNKDAALARLKELVARAIVPPKPRKKTKPSRGAVERRIKAKKQHSERKQRRRKPGLD